MMKHLLLGFVILLFHKSLEGDSARPIDILKSINIPKRRYFFKKSEIIKKSESSNSVCRAFSIEDLLLRKNSQFNTTIFRPFNRSNLFRKLPERINKCIPLNKDKNGSFEVLLLNNSQLLQQLSKDGNPKKKNHCTVVLFYAAWCPYSIRMIPHYHALARTFQQLDVVAVDACNFSHLSSRYGAISVPTMIIFHDDKAFSKFNASQWSIKNFINFVNNVTGFSVDSNVELNEGDMKGPLPTTLSQDTDHYLWMAWALIIACGIYALRFYLRHIRIITSLFDFASYRANHHHID